MSTKKFSLLEIFIWFFILILLLLVISPFALGFKIKTDYNALVNNLSSIMQADVQIVSYNKGFFTSEALLEMRFPNAPFSMQFKENIIHGPVYLGLLNQGKLPFVAAVVQGEMLPVAGFEAETQQIFSGSSPLVYQMLIDYNGNVESDAYMPAINTSMQLDNGSLLINSSAMIMKTYYHMSSQSVSGDVSLPAFSVSDQTGTFTVDDVAMSFSANMGQNGLLMGDSNLSMRKLDMQSGADQFAIHDFRIRTVNSEVGELINSHAEMNAREIYASNEKFGPAVFNLSLNGLNANSLKQIQQMQQEIETKTAQGIPPEQINAMVAGQMITLVPDLIKQASLKIQPFRLQSDLGTLETTVDFSVEGIDQNAPADPMYMLSAINLDVNLSIDEKLMRQIVEWYLVSNEQRVAAMGDETARKAEANVSMEQKVSENLQGLIGESWLVYNDGVYTSRIGLHQGQMQLNDKQVDPMQQIMSQMAPPGDAAQ